MIAHPKEVLPGEDSQSTRVAAEGDDPAPRSSMGVRRAGVLVLVHLLVLAHIVHWLVSGETLTPLEPSEAGETLLTGVVNAGFLLFALALFSTLLLGRFFCGWACHVVAYQDLAAHLLRRLGLRPRPVRSRLLLVVPFYAAFSMFAWPSIERYWIAGEDLPAVAWHLTSGDFWERFPGVWMTLATVVVCGGLVIWVLGAKGFCTYACPYGALFGLVGRHAPGRIRVSDACEGCGHCTAVCTSEVRVHAEVARFGQVVDAACMRCMDCVSACPKDALSFGFGLDPGAKAKGRLGFLARLTRPPKENARWDFGWGEEFLLALICGLSIWSLRGAYGLVPFLLALALAILVAFGSVTLLRLVTEKNLLVQHIQLRSHGRFTGAGFASLLLLPLALALVAHTGLVQFHAKEGERLLVELSEGNPVELESIAAHLGSASDLALIDTFKLENQLGQLLVRMGQAQGAEQHLIRAVELEPESTSARVELAWIYARAGDPDRAAEALAPIARFAPLDPNLARSVGQMLARYPNHAGLLSLR